MPNEKWTVYKNHETGILFDITDADAQGKLTAILDGTTIDSFSDVESALADKVDVVSGKGLSTNDYDNTEKAKVAGAFPRSEQAVLGAKNLLDISNHTQSGATVSTSGNGLTIAGNAAVAYPFVKFSSYPAGSYKVYLDVSNISLPSGNKVYAGFRKANNSFAGSIQITENGHYEAVINTTEETTFQILPKTDSATEASSVTVTNVMITLATETDPTYAPYAMTNEQLTNALAVKNDATQITSDNMTIEKCIIAKAGNIRVCTIRAIATTSISAMATIFKGFPDPLLESLDCQTSAEFVNASDNSLYPVIGRSVGGNLEVSTKNAIASGVTIRGTITYVAK